VVLIHVAGVLVSSRLHHENLVLSMSTGRKLGAAAEGIRRAWYALAVLLLAGVLAFWWLQWRSVPTRAVSSVTAAASVPAEKASPPRDNGPPGTVDCRTTRHLDPFHAHSHCRRRPVAG
jgi:hypothetical protein